ncbi:MAG: hypothetical protein MUO21_04270, partial [Nitrososphaeraceae archaeon]|nr:hypothetical protein [Nitrososphaeraceae archaeon]
GIYPIEGLDKGKIKLSDAEKKRMNKYIFSHKFSKKDLANMQKQFGLVYDAECMLDFCKNDGSIATFNYLIDLGIKPTVECLTHLIPKHCGHKNVRNILEKSI